LKRDLGKLDAYFSTFPEGVREEGIMSFAHHPPLEGDFLTVDLWNRFLPRWRNIAENPMKTSAKDQTRILEMLDRIAKVRPVDRKIGSDDADFMMVTHSIPVRRGKWRIVSREVEEAGDK